MAPHDKRRSVLPKAIVAYLLITLVVAWPLLMAIGSRVPVDAGDPLFNTWVLAWDSHALLTNPAGLFAANIFYPYRDTLAYSDLLLPPALLVTPVNLLSGNPMIAYNLLILASFVFSATAMFLLARFLTGSEGVAFVAGAAYSFSTYRMAQMGHIQLLTDGFLVMTVYFAHRWLVARRRRDAALCAVFLTLQALSGWYYGFYGALVLALFILFFVFAGVIRLDRKLAAPLLLMSVIVGAGVAPFALRYLKLARTLPGFSRNLGETAYFSAKPVDYLSTTNPVLLRVFGGAWAPKAGVNWEHLLWPGVFAVLGTVVAAVITWRRSFKASGEVVQRAKIKRFYLLLGLVALVLSFGPFVTWGATRITMPYWFLWRWLPGFKALRVPARLGILVTLSLVVLAAYGWQELVALYGNRFGFSPALKRRLVVAACLGVVIVQATWPFKLSPEIPSFGRVPPVYRWLAGQSDKRIIELPSVDVKEGAIVGGWNTDVRYLYYSTYHWNRLVNGYSGYTPPEYAQIIEVLAGFPDGTGAAVLRRLNVDYLIYHTGGNRRLAASLMKRAGKVTGVKVVRRFGDDIVFAVRPEASHSPSRSVAARLRAPAATPVGRPVNIAWRVLNTTKERLVVRPGEEPGAGFTWQDGSSGSAWPRLPLVLEPGAETWMRAQIDGPAGRGRRRLRINLSSPLIKESSYSMEVNGVAGMPVSVDNNGLGGRFTGVSVEGRAMAGSKLPVKIGVVNRGKAVWTVKFDPDASLEVPFDRGEVHLAAFWYDKDRRQLGDPQVLGLAYDIGPGQRYTETYFIDTPPRPGRYTLRLDIVALGVVWFKDLGLKRPSFKVKVY
ncbi:MAG: hypothetical protein Q8L35_07770 [Actinomycetota bacterium]|nr:hypothetical protein [Actinomycetota bacterium]